MKKINLGTSDFKEIIDSNSYFIDKTLIVKEFLEDTGKIVLVPRPRRFGKTLNMSILKYFLEKCDDGREYLFKGLNIEKEKDIMDKQGLYPVIYLSFKDEKHSNFDKFTESMKKQISSLYKRFYYIYDSLEFENDKAYFDNMINQECTNQDLEVSLFKLSEEYSKFFGFTEEEISLVLNDFNCGEEENEFRLWYNGYKFGREVIYNPWSVLYYLSERVRDFKPYWVNTADDKIIKSLLAEGTEEIKLGLGTLYNGGYVETEINEDVVMSELSNGKQNIWSFLLLSGYLKPIEKIRVKNKFIYKLAIPNYEIMYLYESIIEKWFCEGFISNDFTNMLKALVIGEIELFEEYFSDYVLKSFSYFDISGENPERVYHAFILGMLVSLSETHEIISNRESGLGRYDVSLIPKYSEKLGIIMEFKSIKINSKMTVV